MNTDILPKFTFGFLMAQLFPGAVAILGITCPFHAARMQDHVVRVDDFLSNMCQSWFTSVGQTVTFLFLAVGTGMLIHGIHWMILARLEDQGAISEREYHQWCLPAQIVIAPLIMMFEGLYTAFWSRGIESLSMEENVPDIPENNMAQFNYLQEFYLHFMQFYAHTAYALLICIPSLAVTFHTLGYSINRWLIMAALYLVTGVFFITGRAQMVSLFRAEHALKRIAENQSEPVASRTPASNEVPVGESLN